MVHALLNPANWLRGDLVAKTFLRVSGVDTAYQGLDDWPRSCSIGHTMVSPRVDILQLVPLDTYHVLPSAVSMACIVDLHYGAVEERRLRIRFHQRQGR